MALAPLSPPSAPTGHDFAAQVGSIYRVGACGSDGALAARMPARAVAAHCRRMARRFERYRKRWLDRAMPYLAELRPAGLPARVVYPFGGGDLVTALATFPDAEEITTISLEAAGDPRPIDSMSKRELEADLDKVGHVVERLLQAAHSTTKSLQAASHSKLPGTLLFALSGLAIHGFEPVSLRYFRITDDGSLHYLELAELEEGVARFKELARAQSEKERVLRKKKLQVWREQVAVFGNMEVGFRKRGDTSAPLRTYRHIVANLDDPHLADAPGLIRHLEAKGKVAAMTKAASYLLWMDEFSTIRSYLLGHVEWMISDSSGIPPEYAGPAGFEQTAYGDYAGPYFYYTGRTVARIRKQFDKLWAKPARALPFRYGYPDSTRKGNHLMITRRVAP
ncbi:MAG TPA: hypothetical protein VML75_19680 [Kofleriaceae bacterium]|nr:hypothetical protein [Kofleriaceae bacterium]